jgi:hypothetical protein
LNRDLGSAWICLALSHLGASWPRRNLPASTLGSWLGQALAADIAAPVIIDSATPRFSVLAHGQRVQVLERQPDDVDIDDILFRPTGQEF